MQNICGGIWLCVICATLYWCVLVLCNNIFIARRWSRESIVEQEVCEWIVTTSIIWNTSLLLYWTHLSIVMRGIALRWQNSSNKILIAHVCMTFISVTKACCFNKRLRSTYWHDFVIVWACHLSWWMRNI